MAFLSGSTTFERFEIIEDPTDTFGDDHLKKLKKNHIGAFKTNLYEQPNVGFTGGRHLLDTDFSFEKNILGDALHFGIRIDSFSLPGSIKKAWTEIELKALMIDNADGKPTKAQKEEAKEAVDTRCADEADKGNFRRMGETAVLWDAATEAIYLGSTSEKSNDMCLDLLERVFELKLRRMTASRLAVNFAETEETTAKLYEAQPTSFFPNEPAVITWWNGMQDNYDYLGNEFMLWLWWHWETKSDKIELYDGSEVSGMFARTLALDCPQGESGKETISSDAPTQLAETNLAIRMGKLPRKAGLTLVRDNLQFDFTIQPETFSINGARISHVGDSMAERDTLYRIDCIRQLSETIDLLFHTFCEKRLSKNWLGETAKIAKWLNSPTDTKRRSAA